MNKNNRPRYLNLLQIRFPVQAVLSIGHRLSGVLLFILIPVLIYALERSLAGAGSYNEMVWFFGLPWMRLLLLLLIWAVAHHLFAGIRYLLIDLDLFVDRPQARASAWLVFACGLLVAAFSAWRLF